MTRIAMAEQEAVQAIDPARAKIAAYDAFEIACSTRVEKPIASSASQMHRGAFVDIQHSDFGVGTIGPARALEINMAGRDAGK